MNLADLIKDREGFFWFINNEFSVPTGGRFSFTRVDEDSVVIENKTKTVAAVIYFDAIRKVHLTDKQYFELFQDISDKYKSLTGTEIEISKHYPVIRE